MLRRGAPLTVVLGLVLATAGPAVADTADGAAFDPAPRPAVFVHGMMGSASQFESQAMRLQSNGYPPELITGFDYDSMALDQSLSMDELHELLDDHIDEVLATHDVDEVDLLGHSRGTTVSHAYLNSDPARADRVAHYVNLDGSNNADAAPGDVPTLAVWAEGNADAEIPGAENVHLTDQGHTEVVSSEETFAEIYAFLTGQAPTTTQIEPQTDDEVTLAGRVTIFPDNIGADGATLTVRELHPATGEHVDGDPVAVQELDETGAFGPFAADAGALYEYLVERADGSTHRVYRSPSPRTNHLVRVQTSDPDGLAAGFFETSPDHATLTISRDREWWGDQGDASDVLEIDGTSVLNEATAPRRQSIIAVFAFDDGSDGESDVSEPIGLFSVLPFLTGVDLHIPGRLPAQGSFVVRSEPRGGGHSDEFVVPAVASQDADGNTHALSVHFADHHQEPIARETPTAPSCPDEAGVPPFTDVPADNVHAEAIHCGATLDLVRGLGDGTLAPARATTRGQMASFIARLLEHTGHELPAADRGFVDVPEGHVHGEAIGSLTAAGVLEGRTPDRFAPGSSVERAQAASMLVRALSWAHGERLQGAPAELADRHDIPPPHLDAVDAAVAHGLLQGHDDGTLRPRASVRRDQTASIITRGLDQLR